jgi:NADPH:quinone reductase-like Zn-dependent oxidoreductase
LGMDFSGIIKQIGEDISSNCKQGDEVYGQTWVTKCGSEAFAEIALTNIENIALKPKSLSYIWGNSFTSCRC